MLCCDWKEHQQKSLQIELVTKYDKKDAQKESLVGGSKSTKGGPYPLWHRQHLIERDVDLHKDIKCLKNCRYFTIEARKYTQRSA